jgi:hypothetical protein
MVKTNAAWNKHEGPAEGNGSHLQGGTALLAFHEMIKVVKSTKGGNDFRGLGRWASWVMTIDSKHRTRVVAVYGVGKSKVKGLGTVYQQHLQYIQEKNLNKRPRKMFEVDFPAVLRVRRSNGERLLIFADFNDHILTGRISQRLLNNNKFHLKETSHKHWGKSEPNTWIRGKQPIDGVFHTDDLEITGILMMPFSKSAGDHRTYIVDITSLSAVGKYQFKTVFPSCRCLTMNNDQSFLDMSKL